MYIHFNRILCSPVPGTCRYISMFAQDSCLLFTPTASAKKDCYLSVAKMSPALFVQPLTENFHSCADQVVGDFVVVDLPHQELALHRDLRLFSARAHVRVYDNHVRVRGSAAQAGKKSEQTNIGDMWQRLGMVCVCVLYTVYIKVERSLFFFGVLIFSHFNGVSRAAHALRRLAVPRLSSYSERKSRYVQLQRITSPHISWYWLHAFREYALHEKSMFTWWNSSTEKLPSNILKSLYIRNINMLDCLST